MADFTLANASNATTNAIETRVIKAQFGDGYEQRSPDGINNVRNVWSVDFSPLPSSVAQAIIAFLAARFGATSFTWVNPDGVTERVVAETWARTFLGGLTWGVTATFRQVFEP